VTLTRDRRVEPWSGGEGELEVAIDAAHAAGALLLDRFGRADLRRRRKGAHDVVTEVDLQAEDSIMAALRTAFPADRQLGEESGLRTPRAASRRTWVVDPLDGSINYAAGLPFWCVSIALAVGPDVVLGVIHDPLRAETVVATAGGGAHRLPDQATLAIRRLQRTGDAVVVADPGAVGDPAAAARIERLRPTVRAVRVLGSIAASLTSLALNRLDGVLQARGLQAVDIAAAGLIAREAGAVVTAADGGVWLDLADPSRGGGIAAAGPALHRRLMASRYPVS